MRVGAPEGVVGAVRAGGVRLRWAKVGAHKRMRKRANVTAGRSAAQTVCSQWARGWSALAGAQAPCQLCADAVHVAALAALAASKQPASARAGTQAL